MNDLKITERVNNIHSQTLALLAELRGLRSDLMTLRAPNGVLPGDRTTCQEGVALMSTPLSVAFAHLADAQQALWNAHAFSEMVK